MKKILSILGITLVVAVLSLVSTSDIDAKGKSAAAKAAKPSAVSIVEIVLQDDGEFDVLQAAVIKAGLVDALNGRGQLTVFAPTDQAFVETFEQLLGGPLTEQDVIDFIENDGVDQAFGEGALENILLYHVTQGRRISTSVLASPSYRMLNGDVLTRESLSQAGIAAVDISASNGVVHVINSVLLP